MKDFKVTRIDGKITIMVGKDSWYLKGTKSLRDAIDFLRMLNK